LGHGEGVRSTERASSYVMQTNSQQRHKNAQRFGELAVSVQQRLRINHDVTLQQLVSCD